MCVQIASNANLASGKGAAARTADSAAGDGGTDGAGSSSSSSSSSSAVGQALAVATAPVSCLFQTLGRIPGWFSDAVFEVCSEP